jgi:hypothetical protein
MFPLDAPTVLLYTGEVNEAASAAAGHVRRPLSQLPRKCSGGLSFTHRSWIRWPASRRTGHCRPWIAGSARQQPDGPRSPVHRTYCVSSGQNRRSARPAKATRHQPRSAYSAVAAEGRRVTTGRTCLANAVHARPAVSHTTRLAHLRGQIGVPRHACENHTSGDTLTLSWEIT